jgi:hypothetical protein
VLPQAVTAETMAVSRAAVSRRFMGSPLRHGSSHG